MEGEYSLTGRATTEFFLGLINFLSDGYVIQLFYFSGV